MASAYSTGPPFAPGRQGRQEGVTLNTLVTAMIAESLAKDI